MTLAANNLDPNRGGNTDLFNKGALLKNDTCYLSNTPDNLTIVAAVFRSF